jgi:hypothetical protein
MNTKIKTIVNTTDVEIIASDDFLNPFSNKGSLYYDTDEYLVDIDVDGLTIKCNIWIGEEEYIPTEEEVNYFYDVISKDIMNYNDSIKEGRYQDYMNQDTFYNN